MGEERLSNVLVEAFRLALRDLAAVFPRIALSIVVVALMFAAGLILTRFTKWLVNLTKLDSYLEPYVRNIGVRASTLILIVINVGIAFAAIYAVSMIVVPNYLNEVVKALEFLAKLVSIVFMVIFVFVIVNAITVHMRIVAKVRGFMVLLSALMVTVLVLDATALSPEVKYALSWGISLGLGISIGVFTAWYFFHEVFERKSI
ncbi:MAG: hypothetical protein DRO12_00085 [Thermoprotei archaeon]|nr:MAG: hypothetical protein DRO12_00085 [Thermoprotei archaeon]